MFAAAVTPSIKKEEVYVADAIKSSRMPGGGRGRGMPKPSRQLVHALPQRQFEESRRGRCAGRFQRAHDTHGRGGGGRGDRGSRGVTQKRSRVYRIVEDARPRKKVSYTIRDWCRDSVLELVGIDPYDSWYQYEFQINQELSLKKP